MADQPLGLTRQAVQRTAETTRRVLGRLPDTQGKRRRLQPRSCAGQNAVFIITLIGPPTGGTWGIDSWEVDGSTDTLSGLAHNISAASLETALEGHSGIGSGNVTVTGGAGNVANFRVELMGDLANLFVELPLINFGSLTGTGVGGLAYVVQIGR